MFCWVELATPDPAGAKRFYSELFDWFANDMPAGEGMTYTMCPGGSFYGIGTSSRNQSSDFTNVRAACVEFM